MMIASIWLALAGLACDDEPGSLTDLDDQDAETDIADDTGQPDGDLIGDDVMADSTPDEARTPDAEQPIVADVMAVAVTGEPGGYQFAVTIRSPDIDCDQYANWWEVVTPEGALVYRRILMHSHPDEQPFTRSGGPVEIAADAEVIVRAYMHSSGYGGGALRGTAGSGFEAAALADGFAEALATVEPLPDDCWY